MESDILKNFTKFFIPLKVMKFLSRINKLYLYLR